MVAPDKEFDKFGQKRPSAGKSGTVLNMIPAAVVPVIGATVVSGVTNALPGGWVGSGLAGLMALVVLVGGLIRLSGFLDNDRLSTQEKVERLEDRKSSRTKVKSL